MWFEWVMWHWPYVSWFDWWFRFQIVWHGFSYPDSFRIQCGNCGTQKSKIHNLGCRRFTETTSIVEALLPEYTRYIPIRSTPALLMNVNNTRSCRLKPFWMVSHWMVSRAVIGSKDVVNSEPWPYRGVCAPPGSCGWWWWLLVNNDDDDGDGDDKWLIMMLTVMMMMMMMNSDHDSSLSLPPGLGFYSIISTHFQRSSSWLTAVTWSGYQNLKMNSLN